MARYERKTKDVWQLYGNWGYGWDMIAAYDSKKEATVDLIAYRENDLRGVFALKKTRVKKEAD